MKIMRTAFSVFSIFLFLSFSLSGQITYKNNCIRNGDQIIKQQVEYKDPGREGGNVIWDFSKLKSVNDEYKLNYSAPMQVDDSTYLMGRDSFSTKQVNEEDLIIGTEHFTEYYYRVKDNQLIQLGHRNPVSELNFNNPIPVMPYPFEYKQKVSTDYTSLSIYSGTEKMYLGGTVAIEADAQGIMILPNKDTQQNVIRTISTQTIVENTDSLNKKYAHIPEHVRDQYKKEPYKSTIKTYRWYVKGYRYPIFETIQNINTADSLQSVQFATAFFFPPQEHYSLENDEENLAVLDSLKNPISTDPNNPDNNWLEKNFTYNFFPNPVDTDLQIEYGLEEPASVSISLYNGTSLIKSIPSQEKQIGVYSESFSCWSLLAGTYILQIKVRDEIISNVIIKR